MVLRQDIQKINVKDINKMVTNIAKIWNLPKCKQCWTYPAWAAAKKNFLLQWKTVVQCI